MIIREKDNKIIFEFPKFQRRFNPYMMDDEQNLLGSYPTFTGLIVRHKENGSDWDEMGFAGTIDMDYKGKPDQVSDIIVSWNGDEESFKKKCEELKLNVHEMTLE